MGYGEAGKNEQLQIYTRKKELGEGGGDKKNREAAA